jgi:tripartite-type tricarboxylate transporter receptor subunit TctC
LFKALAKVNLTHIPYKGSGPAMTDLIGGQIQLMFENVPTALPFIKAAKIRALGVTSRQRAPTLPDVPAIAESGYREFDMTSWWGLLAPAGVPKEIIARLHGDAIKVLNTADMKERLASQGAVVVTNTPEQFAAYIKSEIANWGRVVAVSGARMD